MKTLSPNIPFGLEDAIWAGDPSGHKWIHKPDQLQSHINQEVRF